MLNKINPDSYLDQTDTEIWNAFREGSESAFEFIYKAYFDKLYNYGRQFTSDQSLVEDAIQELFIELRKRSAHLSATNKILPYLYSAYRRKILRLRDRENRSQEFEPNTYFEITLSVEEEIITSELKREDLEKLQSAMEGLSPKYREILYHFYYENLSYIEIQDILGFDSIKSVRNLLYKAINTLKKSIVVALLIFWSQLFPHFSRPSEV